jgi:hypothetical protein
VGFFLGGGGVAALGFSAFRSTFLATVFFKGALGAAFFTAAAFLGGATFFFTTFAFFLGVAISFLLFA